MKLTGLRFLITGASAGIGADLARALATSVEGAKLVLAARRAPELEALAAEVRARGRSAAVVLLPAMMARGQGAVVMMSSLAAWTPTDRLEHAPRRPAKSPLSSE